MSDYSRPASGMRFRFDGIKTNAVADAFPEYKYAYAQNIRAYDDFSITSRPQFVQSIAAPGGGGPVLSLEPTIGVYKIGSSIYVNGVSIDTGYAPGLGCSIMPFRPSASPNAYDYVFDDNKSSKVVTAGATIVQKAGIAEPQTPPEAAPDQFNVFPLALAAVNFTQGGTAGAPSNVTRLTDIAIAFFPDPASVPPSLATRYSMQVGNVQYQVGASLGVSKSTGGIVGMVVQDVFPPINTQVTALILSIFYFAGATGRAVIVPNQMPISTAVPEFQGASPVGSTIAANNLIASLRRGSLLRIGTGGTAETVFVLNTVVGPQGLVSFECVTVNTHAAGENIAGVPAVAVSFVEPPALLTGQAITVLAIQFTNAVGTGTMTEPLTAPGNPFINAPFVPDPAAFPTAQEDDYIHMSINVSDLTLLTEIRLYWDVNNGAADFATNAFYYAVRSNDLIQAIAGTQSQFGAAQIISQRGKITSELTKDDVPSRGSARAIESPTRGATPFGDERAFLEIEPTSRFGFHPGTQTTTGTSQWSEVMFSIRSLTRIGNDQTRTLANTQAVRIQVVSTGAVTVQFSSIWVSSGGQPDVGSNTLYFYRVRPRSKVAGVIGNPSPQTRYGVGPRRQNVIVSLPSPAYDTQIDTWDVFRFGGSVTSWRYVGSVASSSATFTDKFFDNAVAQSETLDFNNLEPFPSIGQPITSTTSTIAGTVALITFPTAAANPAAIGTLSQLQRLLPGNVLNIGARIFTLWTRPVFMSTGGGVQTYRFEFVENAGTLTNPLVILQEPTLAAQGSRSVWGPDSNGVMFAVEAGAVNNLGVGLRPGLIQWTNNNNPDGANDANTSDICPTSEPLQNGALLGNTPVVFSGSRAWRGFARQNGSYNWQEIPVGAGLAAQFGICTDGELIYFVAKDGIRKTAGGNSASLTDEDLYNLFPHEGVFPQNVTYAGNTIFAPEYKFAANFRLSVVNGFLYFDYMDSTQTQRTLVCHLRKNAWSVDSNSGNAITIHSGVKSPASNNQIPASATRFQQLFVGDTAGAILSEQSIPVASAGEIVTCAISTKEDTFGDIRANKIFGDASLDVFAPGGAITVTPVFLGSTFAPTVIAGAQVSRYASPPTINLLGEQIKRSMGLTVNWIDQGVNSVLFAWQPSYITQPEDISNRITDWDNGGTEGNKFIQGFSIECDTLNAIKGLQVRDSDTQTLHPFTSAAGTNVVQANGQQIIVCSFVTPFSAHSIRIEPTDSLPWRLFGVKWIYQPTPSVAQNWQTQGTSFGYCGYWHIIQIAAAYSSTAPVTLNITCFDGLVPAPIILPSTGGQYRKITFTLTPNKGRLYTFQGVAASGWQAYWDDWCIYAKPWGSSEAYERKITLGGMIGNRAEV